MSDYQFNYVFLNEEVRSFDYEDPLIMKGILIVNCEDLISEQRGIVT